MAGERIEQEAVPVSEVLRDALRRADKALRQMPRGFRVAASIGLILAMTGSQARTGEGVVEASVLPPAKSKEATLEVSAAQIPPAPEILAVNKCKIEVVRDEVEKYDVNVEEVIDFLSSQGIGSETSIELHLIDKSFKEIWGGKRARETIGCRHGKCEETHSYFIEFYMKDDLKDFVLPKEYGENVLIELEGVDAWNWAMAHSLYHIIEIEKTDEVESYPHHELTATQFANENFERPFFIEKEGSRK
ncbi:MAG: hypothetical protein LiPW31_106 [Microgenomates group bacterium LiPW_31]|nr:MAG: hypothetical protein LiPW31_106 [Microgenomates group bacterium LiPW_31]